MPRRVVACNILFLLVLVAEELTFTECFAPKEEEIGGRNTRQVCDYSPTTVNGRETCSKRLIFEDNFDGPNLNPSRWKPDLQIAGFPDYEFSWFTDDPKNLFIRDGVLYLKPTLVSTANNFLTEGTIDLTKKGCTGDEETECLQRAASFNILPPVASARVRSKDRFSFRYGRVEVRAKLPDGFWLYPEMYLEPAERSYGREWSGRAVLALSRGNARLEAPGGGDAGAGLLEAGLQPRLGLGSASDTMRTKQLAQGAAWNERFHTFTFTWTPDGVSMAVDGEKLGDVTAPRLGFGQTAEGAEAWSTGSKMAPFDREFYITLGLGVGGVTAFPDDSSSAGKAKPWKNTSVKARLNFLRDKITWRDTWAWDDAALQVDYIKVWAL